MFRFAALVLVATLGGCTDSLGLGEDCRAEMTTTRLSEGGGPDETRRSSAGGDFTELWIYYEGGRADRVYTFRWGASYEFCEVDGPSAASRDLLARTGPPLTP